MSVRQRWQQSQTAPFYQDGAGWCDDSGGTPRESNPITIAGTSTATTLTTMTHVGAFKNHWYPGRKVRSGGQTFLITSQTDDVLTSTLEWSGGGSGPGAGDYTISFSHFDEPGGAGAAHMETDPTTGDAAWTTDKFNAYEGGARVVTTPVTLHSMFVTAYGYDLVRPVKNNCVSLPTRSRGTRHLVGR